MIRKPIRVPRYMAPAARKIRDVERILVKGLVIDSPWHSPGVRSERLADGRVQIRLQEPKATGSPAPSPCLHIVSAAIVNPGSGYVVGDLAKPIGGVLCPPADNFGFELHVDSVDGGGGVTAVTVIDLLGYTEPPVNPVAFAGTGGSGLTANCTFA